MTLVNDTSITADAGSTASVDPYAATISGPGGVWTLDGQALVVADSDGPATVIVPAEAVRLLVVDLPIANRAKRLAALPFAVEDLIAEPVEHVHLALGREVAPKRYLIGVVSHAMMSAWTARIDGAGLGHAALVPDSLALPQPVAGEWAVDLGTNRAVIRTGDGGGFAIPAPMLVSAWEAAGRPRSVGYGAPLPPEMAGPTDAIALSALSARVLDPALDLRQGAYARQRRRIGSWGRRLAWIGAVGIAAHSVIAAADTLVLRSIADRRADETRELVRQMAPGAPLSDGDLAGSVADLLPRQAAAGGEDKFLPVAARVSAALAPLSGTVPMRAMSFAGGTVTMTVDSVDPALAGKIESALKDANVRATVSTAPDGIRIAAPVA